MQTPDASIPGDQPLPPPVSVDAAVEWNAASTQMESLSRDFSEFEERASRLWDQAPKEEPERENASLPLNQEPLP